MNKEAVNDNNIGDDIYDRSLNDDIDKNDETDRR